MLMMALVRHEHKLFEIVPQFEKFSLIKFFYLISVNLKFSWGSKVHIYNCLT